MIKIFSQLFNLIYPEPDCIFCSNKTKDILCDDCKNMIVEKMKKEKSKRNYEDFIVESAFIYRGEIRELIHKYKFKNKQALGQFFAYLIFEFYRTCENIPQDSTLVYIPSFFLRNFQRRFSHMKNIAKCFSKKASLPLNSYLIFRIKPTKPLHKLKIEERKKVLKNCFFINDTFMDKSKPILIIDDIVTTGATLKECVKALRNKGFKKVYAITLASTEKSF